MSMMLFGPALNAEVSYRTERLRAAAGLDPLGRHVAEPGARTADGVPVAAPAAPRRTVRERGSGLRRAWYLRVSGAWHAAR